MEPWLQWISQVLHLHFLSIPRQLYITNHVQVELIGFSDASTAACACCLYARSTDASGQIQVTLIAARTKLSPLQTTSVPRLELCAALLLAHLADKVSKCLGVKKVTNFVDSTTALQWIRGCPSRWKTYVSNRVSQITELFGPECWFFVGTHENPSDQATRGISAADLLKSRDWWSGPVYLGEPREMWPQSPIPEKDTAETTAEATAAISQFVYTYTRTRNYGGNFRQYSSVSTEFAPTGVLNSIWF
jgi:hypothetical protein